MERKRKPAIGTSPDLEIRVLGELAVLRGGRPLNLPASRKTRALLGFLALAPGDERRERLCDIFWDAPEDPRGSLRWSLSKLRPLLDGHGVTRLRADRERVALDLGVDAELDLARVRGTLAGGVAQAPTAELARAAAAFRGELLGGLDLTGCHRFYTWLLAVRADARRLHAMILGALIERPDVEPHDAVAHARALVEIEPSVQHSHVQLVRLLSRLGRISEARAQFDASVRALRDLGETPGPELAAAHVALSSMPAGAAIAPLPSRSTPHVKGISAAPFVGRAPELAALQTLVDDAASGAGRGVAILTGDPGIGKTRLLDELAAAAHRAGALVLRGRAFQAEMVRPFGPWIDALRGAPLGHLSPELTAPLATLLPELGGAHAAFGDNGRNHIFDAVGRVLAALRPEPCATLVILDDLQWSDEASLALLHYIARSSWAGRIALAAAVREGEVADNVAATRVLRALAREGRLARFALGPLAEHEMATLLDNALGADAMMRVFAESGGNPLFAIEVASALARGADVLSETLDELIADRLARLSDEARLFVPWASTLGRGFSAEILARVAGRPSTDAIAALDELERAAIIRAAVRGGASPGPAGYDFSHDLVREAAYRKLSTPRRQALHLQIARALEAEDDASGTLAGEIALHAARGGDALLAATTCVRAAERCVRLFAFRDATEVAQRGLAYAAELPALRALPLRVRLLELHVHAGLVPHRQRALAATFLDLVGELEEAGLIDDVQRCFAQIVRLEYLGGDFAGLHAQVSRGAEATRARDSGVAARALAASGACLAWLEDDLPRAHVLLTEAREIAREANIELSDLEVGLGLLEFHAGDEAGAITRLEAAVRLAQETPDPWIAYTAALQLVVIHLEAGRTSAARVHFPGLGRLAATFGQGSEEPVVESLARLTDLIEADAGATEKTDAEASIESAVAALRAHDHKRMLAFVLAKLAERALTAGDLPRAASMAEEARVVADVLGRRSERLKARMIAARIAAARGDSLEVTRLLAEIDDDLRAPGGATARLRAAAVRLRHQLRKSAA